MTFKLSHGDANLELALKAADDVEVIVGGVIDGTAKLKQIKLEDLALLVQFVRNSTSQVVYLVWHHTTLIAVANTIDAASRAILECKQNDPDLKSFRIENRKTI